jgi:hypothetical protein
MRGVRSPEGDAVKLGKLTASLLGGLTSGSTGLAASESLKFNLDCSPVIRGVRALLK